MKAKSALLSVALLAFAPALHGAGKNRADYPVKFAPLVTNWYTDSWGVHGTGRGRIDENGQVNGVEFEYTCMNRLIVSYSGEFYPAKWKKRSSKMTVLSHTIGDTNTNTCDVKVEMQDFIYVRKNGYIATVTQKQWAETHAPGTNPQDDDDMPVAGSAQPPPH